MSARLAPLALLALPAVGWAALPMNNRPGDFWEDQWAAARLLPPHVWSIVLAALAVVGTAWFAIRALGRPAVGAPAPASDLSPSDHRRWLLALLAGLVLFYAPGFAGEFSLYDDPGNIWLDPVVSELSWENLRIVLFENHKGVNQEWMFLSLQLCYALFGRDYAGFFALNLALLPVLLLLVHQLAFALLRDRRAALLATALFGLSPIVAELVCWMLARGHYFGLIFALASSVAYLRYLDVRDAPGAPRRRLYALALLAFAASQLGKPISLYVPAWLVLFDLWHRRTDLRRVALEKLPFFAVAGVFLYRIVAAGDRHGRVRSEHIGGSISNTLALDANLVLEYLRFAVVPSPSGLRAPWNEPSSWLSVTGIPDIFVHGFAPLASLTILACLGVCAVVLATRYAFPAPLLGLAAGVASLGTVMNLPVHTVVHAYRYTLSLNVMAAIVLSAVFVRALAVLGSGPTRRSIPVVAAAAFLTFSAVETHANRAAWRTPVDLWTRSADVLYPHDGWSNYYAGKALQHRKRHLACVEHLERAQRAIPDNGMIQRRLGDCWYGAGQHELAARHWQRYFPRNRRQIRGSYLRKLREVGLGHLTPDPPGSREVPDQAAADRSVGR